MVLFGNLDVQGTTNFVNTSVSAVNDSIYILAANNPSDILDSGVVSLYNDGTANQYAGIIRDAGTKTYYVMGAYGLDPATGSIDIADASFAVAPLVAGDITGANVTGVNVNATLANVVTLNANTAAIPDGITSGNVVVTGVVSANDLLITTDGVNGLKANSSTLDVGQVGILANGSVGTIGQMLTSDGTRTFWSTVAGTNVTAQYAWTNTHSFSETVTLSAVSANGSVGVAG
jgi:hypothetical protein